ncbi:MAG TPA: phosphoglycerate kinase [Acidimicrobiia bacterium]
MLTLDDLELEGAKVLVRSDLNVPLDDGAVGDDFRIRMALPTIERLKDAGAVVAVCSHLGRPKGHDPAFSLAPVAARMSDIAGFKVTFLSANHGAEVEAAIGEAEPGSVFMLENTRFEPGETKNDQELAASMAAPFDVFVEDAFGSVHRAHASTVGVAEILRSAAGPLLTAELESLGAFLSDPERPYVVILGGAKISDKLGVVKSLLPRVDSMLIGGGMCFTLLASQGHDVGASLVEDDMIETVGELLRGPDGHKIVLPTDIVVADSFSADAEAKTVGVDGIEAGWMGLDIGPESVAAFVESILAAKSVFWNGPMGVFEWDRFRVGTEAIAEAMARTEAFTAVGGGDSAAALRLLGYENYVSHLSTGGGAGLEMLEGATLPGVEVLKRWK